MDQSFTIVPGPQLHFGLGKISILPSTIKNYGSRIFLVTGARSFTASPFFDQMVHQFSSTGLTFKHYAVDGEPTPAIVDTGVRLALDLNSEVVVAIGGGSALDAGKAISAMIPLNEPVKGYLEGIGSKNAHTGSKIPFVAVPTTAGTGSEAAKNAVLSETGPKGYKRSLRHNNFVPNVAILDPTLTLTCPAGTTASSGMDAFTQLLESYLSPAGNPITDAMALEGLRIISKSLLSAYRDGSDITARAGMSLAAYLSGVTLTNAGLGLVHGFASAIGGFFPVAHGIICSTLMPSVNRVTVKKLRSANSPGALKKYAIVGRIFSSAAVEKSDSYYTDSLLEIIESWKVGMNIPGLLQIGITSADFDKIIEVTENKNNPISLTSDEMREALETAR